MNAWVDTVSVVPIPQPQVYQHKLYVHYIYTVHVFYIMHVMPNASLSLRGLESRLTPCMHPSLVVNPCMHNRGRSTVICGVCICVCGWGGCPYNYGLCVCVFTKMSCLSELDMHVHGLF